MLGPILLLILTATYADLVQSEENGTFDFSASQSNLFDYTALASTEFDFGAASVYAELDGNLTLIDSGEDIRKRFLEQLGSGWTPDQAANLMHVIPTQAKEAKMSWRFAPRSNNERFCLRIIDVIPEAVIDGF